MLETYVLGDENEQSTMSRYDILHPFDPNLRTLKFQDNLRPLAGKQVKAPYTIAEDKPGKTTYAREIDPENLLVYEYRSRLRPSMSNDQYINLGNEYKKTGGFFEIVEPEMDETFMAKNKYSMNFKYILDWFAKSLELSSELMLDRLKVLLDQNKINYFIHEFFEPVDMPKDGDLVVYEDPFGDVHHGGIYRSGNSFPYGGVVQSLKYSFSRGRSHAGVFQHDVFFNAFQYDNLAKFYRIKNVCPYYPIVELWESEKDRFKKMYTVDDGIYHFNGTEENKALREKIKSLNGESLIKEFPEIMSLSHIKMHGVCSDYALKNVLKSFTPSLPFVGTGELPELLNKYFTPQKEPDIGDLVVYYWGEGIEPTHYGIYFSDEIVESKWGKNFVYRHPIFYVDPVYGDTVKFFKVKEEFSQKTME